MKKTTLKLLFMFNIYAISSTEFILPSFKISLEHPDAWELKNLELLYQLSKALVNSQYDQAELIYNKGCDINSISEYGTTLLHLAVDKHDLKAVRFLLNHGADLAVQDTMGQTPLHIAVIQNNIEIVRLLLELSDRKIVRMKNNEGQTALHLAVIENNAEFVRLILTFGDKNILTITDNQGCTPSNYAWNLEMTKLLE